MRLLNECKSLKIYINEDTRYGDNTLYHALVNKFKELNSAGVTVTRGVEGFGNEKRIHTSNILSISSKLPIVIEVVDTDENIKRMLPEVEKMIGDGLVAISDVKVVKYGNKSI